MSFLFGEISVKNGENVLTSVSKAIMAEQNVRFYEFGEFRLDVRRRILFKDGAQVPLSGRIYDVLLLLVENEGTVLSHDELLDKVWEGAFVEQSNLKKSISALRQVLGESPNESLFIKTIPRRGYSFVAPVRALSEETTAEAQIEEVKEENSLAPPGEALTAATESYEPEPASQPKSARSFRSIAISVACIVLLGLIAGIVWQFSRGSVSAKNFSIENLKIQKLTSSGNIDEAALSPDGKAYSYITSGEDGKQTLWTRRMGSPNSLQVIAPTDNAFTSLVISPNNNDIYYSAIVSGQESLYRISITGGEPRKLAENTKHTVTFSPDGKRMGFMRDLPGGKRALFTASAQDGSDEKEVYSVTDNHKLILPQWSPDNKKFAFISSDSTDRGRIWTISEIPVEGGQPREILTSQRGKVYYYEWLRDGTGLVACTEPNDLTQSQLWHVAYPNGEMTRMTNDIATYQNVSISADGNTMLAIQSERAGNLWVMNWSLLQNSTRVTDSQNFIGRFAVLPEDKIIAEAVENGQRGLIVLNPDGTNSHPLFSQSNIERVPSVSKDGKELYFVSMRSGTQEIWRTDIDGRNPQKLTDLKTFLHTVRRSPDGKSVYFHLYDGVRWRMAKMPAAGGEHSFVFEETAGEYDFSPDGTMMAYAFFDDKKQAWQAALRTLADNVVVKQFDIAPSSMLLWTKDGKALLYTVSDTMREGGSLWMQPIDGSAPKPVLETKEDKVLWAEWSQDGSKLYFTRGKTTSNIVLITKGKAN